MRKGVVTNEFDAIIEIQLRTAGGRFERMNTILDTGFTGWLTLPPERIRSLDLLKLGMSRVGLADGTFIIAGRYEAVVLWNGQERLVPVEEADAEPLLGMRMLDGCDLYATIRRGGQFSITPSK